MLEVGGDMDGYDKMLMLMRKQGAVLNSPKIVLGTMTGNNTCEVHGIELDSDDLIIAEHLLKKICTDVQKEEYISPLKAGDEVVLYPVIANDKYAVDRYVILEKVVRM